MKQLIFFLLLLPLMARTQNEMPVDDLSKQFVAEVKSSEIDAMLKRTKEFSDCYNDNKFDAADNDGVKKDKLDKASKCFEKKVSGKDDKALKDLSEKLNLEAYGLVKSKNTRDVTEFLTDKMYKAMTGYERKEQDQRKLIESMKFSNKKMIDQSVFIQLYKTQLTKSILQEITTYCFVDFRLKNGNSKTTFESYWGNDLINETGPFTDEGTPKFDANVSSFDTSDPSKNYQPIIESISSNNFKAGDLTTFTKTCMGQIAKLCDAYVKDNTLASGKRSCLVKANLMNMRKAIADTNKIVEQFKKLDGQGVAIALDGGQVAKFHDPNKDASYDELTTRTSKDILEGNADKNLMDEAKKCSDPANASDPSCEKFLSKSEHFDKALFDMEMELDLKKKVQIERIVALKKGDQQKLKDYLTENGFLKALAEYEKGNKDIEKLIGDEYEARKQAALSEMKNKVGKRQVKEDDLKNDPTNKKKEDNIELNAKETLSERARLAQVVMFNNIILGSVDFKDEKGNDLGKISSGLQREASEQGNNNNIKSDFFDGIKTAADAGGKSIDKQTLDGSSIIDLILKP